MTPISTALSSSPPVQEVVSSDTSPNSSNPVEEANLSEIVVESGPVVYSDGEEGGEGEGEEGGLGDADMDLLAYEGDPLLYSDCEDEGLLKVFCTQSCNNTYPLTGEEYYD